MTLAEDKTRVLKVLKERAAVLNRLRIVDILNKNSKADVDAALASLTTDGKVQSEDNIFFSAVTTTTTV